MKRDIDLLRKEYNEFYEGGDFKHFLLADRFFIKSVVDKYHISIGSGYIDVGCGTGKFTKYLYDYGIKSVGVDISEKAIEIALEKYPECAFIREDVTGPLPFEENKFDGILCSGFSRFNKDLESIRNDIGNILKYLKPNGSFIFAKTSNLKYKKSKNKSRTNYKLENHVNFFEGFDNLEVLGKYTLYPQCFILLGRYAFNNFLSRVCSRITLITGMSLRVYIILKKVK